LMMTEALQRAKAAVVRVGDGRGFIVEPIAHKDRIGCFIVTAAPCLRIDDNCHLMLPPAHGAPYSEDRTYHKIIPPLNNEPAISVECLFIDPVSDIAVLGPADGELYYDQRTAYEDLVQPVTPILIGDAPKGGPALLLSLDGEWHPCDVVDTLYFGTE